MYISQVVLLSLAVTSVLCTLESALTFTVPARKEQCFYEEVKEGHEIEVDFQVVDGGDLDIDFAAYDTKSKRVAKNVKESYGSHSIPVKEDGVFKFCFSNKMSTVTSKTVFMDVYVDDGNYDNLSGQDTSLNEEDAVAKNIKTLDKQVDSIKSNLFKAQVQFQLMKAQRNKDMKIQSSNIERVDKWSMVQCVFMVLMGTVQVYLLKQLFKEDKSAKRQGQHAGI